MEGYRKIVPRFCSEIGQQAPATVESLREVMAGEELQVGSRGLSHRQRGTGGMQRHIDEAISEARLQTSTFEHWHSSACRVQEAALQLGIAWLRVQQPKCGGALIWQLNEPWPGISWSIIDGSGRKKRSWRRVQQAFEPRLLSIQPLDGRPMVYGVNDLDQPWTGTLTMCLMEKNVAIVTRQQEVVIPPASVARLADLITSLDTPIDPQRQWANALLDFRGSVWDFR